MNIVELDKLASQADSPYGIITADCSNPKEIDDGIFVQPLPAEQETYRVGVCVVDTSGLYEDKSIFNQAMKNTEAKYWQLPNGELGYDPMFEREVIKGLEFTEGNVRDALMVTFIVGHRTPPSEVDISFGHVEVTRNLNYKKFWQESRPKKTDEKFGRASALIIKHLGYTSGGDYDTAPPDNFKKVYRSLFYKNSGSEWLRGSRINEAFMIAANHLVGKVMAEEGRPAVYRVHDPDDEKYIEIMPPNVARYSWQPGKHTGLNINPYCRVTSPLRRLEDFIMSYELKKRYEGQTPTLKDAKDVATAVRKLNQRIIEAALEDTSILSSRDLLGKNPYVFMGVPTQSEGNVIQLPTAS